LIGKTEVYTGTLVGRGLSTLLTRISRIDPIHVRFTFSEKDYLGYARRKAERDVAPPGSADSRFELLLADGTVHPHNGGLVFVDRAVDPRTGTILGEAAFPNPEQILRPGQYARLRVEVEEKPGALLVPQAAIVELQGTYSVMAVAADHKVQQRLVQPGERIGRLWVIDSGLQPGEQIVVEGLQRIRAGVQVEPQTVVLDEDGQIQGAEGQPQRGTDQPGREQSEQTAPGK
jgi:membrane fusion protein (multidrug efflux system)